LSSAAASLARRRQPLGPHSHFSDGSGRALIKRGFDPAAIEKYGQLRDSITPNDRLLRPLCFTCAGKRSALKPLPEKAGKEPMRCEVCMSIFYSPIPA
jgi:hypothetical protein